jgi:hypothetical protein
LGETHVWIGTSHALLFSMEIKGIIGRLSLWYRRARAWDRLVVAYRFRAHAQRLLAEANAELADAAEEYYASNGDLSACQDVWSDDPSKAGA